VKKKKKNEKIYSLNEEEFDREIAKDSKKVRNYPIAAFDINRYLEVRRLGEMDINARKVLKMMSMKETLLDIQKLINNYESPKELVYYLAQKYKIDQEKPRYTILKEFIGRFGSITPRQELNWLTPEELIVIKFVFEKQINREPLKIEKIGRNEKCPCGSGHKYKKCCLNKDRENLMESEDRAYWEKIINKDGDILVFCKQEAEIIDYKKVENFLENHKQLILAEEDEEENVFLLKDKDEMIKQELGDYYKKWLDMSIPALNGSTPRQASKKPEMREDLIELLKLMENKNARKPNNFNLIPFDIDWIKKELGVEY